MRYRHIAIGLLLLSTKPVDAEIVHGSFFGTGFSGTFSYDTLAPVYNDSSAYSQYFNSAVTEFSFTDSNGITSLDPFYLGLNVSYQNLDRMSPSSISIYGNGGIYGSQFRLLALFDPQTGHSGIPSAFSAVYGDFYCYMSGAPCAGGTASVDLGIPAGVPEPATWAMMTLGFGAMGFAMRRRKTSVAVA